MRQDSDIVQIMRAMNRRQRARSIAGFLRFVLSLTLPVKHTAKPLPKVRPLSGSVDARKQYGAARAIGIRDYRA